MRLDPLCRLHARIGANKHNSNMMSSFKAIGNRLFAPHSGVRRMVFYDARLNFGLSLETLPKVSGPGNGISQESVSNNHGRR